MAYPIYSPFDYSMGAAPTDKRRGPSEKASERAKARVAEVRAAQMTRKESKTALKGMKGSLKRWLKFRSIMDDYVAGKRKPARFFKRPGVKPLPPGVVARTLAQERFATEQDLAETLHSLLVESGWDAAKLPKPDVAQNPDAAAQLAALVIESPIEGEVAGPQAQGIVWFMLAIPVAGIVIVLSQLIKSKADLAAKEAELRCIESGGCTDSGFWLKVASVSVIAWLAWDKLGLKEAAAKRQRKAARG